MTKAIITTEAYTNWLRAGKPTMGKDGLWFFRQEEALQDHLATLGNIDQIERIVAQARAIHDPDGFEAKSYATEADEETAALQQMVAKVTSLLGGENAPVRPPAESAPSMAGAIQRREEADAARIKTTGDQRSLLGRKPDSVRENAG